MKELRIALKGLDCPHCAGEVEAGAAALPGVKAANVYLFKEEMVISLEDDAEENEVFAFVKNFMAEDEPDVVVSLEKPAREEETNLAPTLLRFGIGAALFAAGLLTDWTVLLFASYLVFGWDVLWQAVRNIAKGKVFDENFLMALATVGAIAIQDVPEAVFVMAFYQFGEFFQRRAVERSRKSIKSLMEIRPDFARRIDGQKTAPEEIAVGDLILVTAGERIPLDGQVVEGRARLDTSAVTGESVPRGVTAGDVVQSGAINTDGVLQIRVTKPFGESTAMRILEMTEKAADKKSKTEEFITRFAKVYTPVVVLAAAALAFLPPLFVGNFSLWFGRALTFLVISCPCALVLSVPLTFFSGIGEASKKGILVKGGSDLQALKDVKTLAFDKTGTLTKGVFEVTEIVPAEGVGEDALLHLAAAAEANSNHPIAKAIVKKRRPETKATSFMEAAGRGILAEIDGRKVLAGNHKLMEEAHIDVPVHGDLGTVVHVAADGKYQGYVVVSDVIREDAAEALKRLKAVGVERFVMLTGDSPAVAGAVGDALGIQEVHGGLLPEDKVSILEKLLTGYGKVAFAGDGINDAPVLARADVGIAMGGIGSDAAMEAADVVIMQDSLEKISDGIVIARNTDKIVNQNIYFALIVKAVVLVLGALGFATMWAAVFADVGVAFLAILNAMRKKQ